jgi:hypothetical protein
MIAAQLELGQTAVHRRAKAPYVRRDVFDVPPGDFARPGLVDLGFVERSVAAMRERPGAERELRQSLAGCLQSIQDIDRVYGSELNEWAATTRERLWMEHFTVEAILRGLAGVQASACGADQTQPEQADA